MSALFSGIKQPLTAVYFTVHVVYDGYERGHSTPPGTTESQVGNHALKTHCGNRDQDTHQRFTSD